jgi:hypothetical protein
MPKPDLQPVNLGSISRGALMEIFEIEIAKIAANIADTKTTATKKRKLTLQLTFAPDHDRKVIDVTAQAKTTLAGIADHSSRAYLGKDAEGHTYIFDEDPRQEMLFEPPAEDDVVLQFGRQSKP